LTTNKIQDMIKIQYMHTTILPSFCMVMVIYLLIDDTRNSLYDCIIKFLFDNTREEHKWKRWIKRKLKM